jgi:DNA (cytosine-5)-methyltransferase 1
LDLSTIDLFCGAGGLTVGFHRAGFETALAVDNDRDSIETYNANFDGGEQNVSEPHEPATCASIEDLLEFPEASVIIGGPPCQGFSLLGVQHRKVVELTTGRILDDPRNRLWKHYLRAVDAVEPSVFVMENVPPLLKSEEFAAFESAAEDRGYQIVKAVLLAADYGVPQRRRRAIVIGSRIGRPWLPWPTHGKPALDDEGRPQLTAGGEWLEGQAFEPQDDLPFRHTALSRPQEGRLQPWRTVRHAFLSDGERPLPLVTDDVDWHLGRNPKPFSIKRYRAVPPGGNRFDLPDELLPKCWKNKPSGSTDLFGRLEWDKPSLTIRTEFFKPEKGRYLHPEAHRPITHREAMRLQSFSDDFQWRGSKISVARQVGNAVPPALAYHVALAVKELIADSEARDDGTDNAAA